MVENNVELVIRLWNTGINIPEIVNRLYGDKAKHNRECVAEVSGILYSAGLIPADLKNGPHSLALKYIRESRRNGMGNKEVSTILGIRDTAIPDYLRSMGLSKININDTRWDEVIEKENRSDIETSIRKQKLAKWEEERQKQEDMRKKKRFKEQKIKEMEEQKILSSPERIASWKEGLSSRLSYDIHNCTSPCNYQYEKHLKEQVHTLVSIIRNTMMVKDTGKGYDPNEKEHRAFLSHIHKIIGRTPDIAELEDMEHILTNISMNNILLEQYIHIIYEKINEKLDGMVLKRGEQLQEEIKRSNSIDMKLQVKILEMTSNVGHNSWGGSNYWEKKCRVIAGSSNFSVIEGITCAVIYAMVYKHIKENWEKKLFTSRARVTDVIRKEDFEKITKNISYAGILAMKRHTDSGLWWRNA